MISEDFNTVIDISSLIWDKADYEINRHEYYGIICGVSELFHKLKNEKPNILLRNELLEQMISDFPFDKLPQKYFDYGRIIYDFLGNIGSNLITYTISSTKIKSIPDQIKAHFNEATKNEVGYLVSRIHLDNKTKSVYFSLNYLWNGENNLKTKLKNEIIEHETILVDNYNEIDEFFAKHTPTFRHNPKHNKTRYNTKERWDKSNSKDTFVSRLSCYDNNNAVPQRLLDIRYPKLLNNCFYSFDENNDTFVVFRQTENNFFHGYDEYNVNKIPNEVRKHFNK